MKSQRMGLALVTITTALTILYNTALGGPKNAGPENAGLYQGKHRTFAGTVKAATHTGELVGN